MSLGMGVMLDWLSGGNKTPPAAIYGKKIESVDMEDNALLLGFTDGTKVALVDRGQSCCESRYMTTDDDLQSLIGGKLVLIDDKTFESEETDQYGSCHEQNFVEIRTDTTSVTVVNHNEHNGYYGGFALHLEPR